LNIQAKHYKLQEAELLIAYSQYFGAFDMPVNHMHDTFELYYLMSGERNYFIKDRLYQLRKGDIVFIPKYELHRTLAAGTPHHDRFLIEFSERLFRETIGESYDEILLHPYLRGIRTFRPKPEEQLVLDGIVYRIIRDLKHPQTAHALQVKLLAIDVMLFLARCLERYAEDDSESDPPIHRKISDIAAYINTHYMRPLTLAQLSETFSLSPHYISRIFKEKTGFSFIQYLTYVRIGEAKRLLRESDRKVLEIADQVGFENLAHFNRVFKQTVQLSPSQYRRMSGSPLSP
jgi:AraC-like DNA-binding protein